MKKIILTVAALTLSACSTTPDEMRAEEPAQVYSSEKSAQEVSVCIEESWNQWVNKFADWGVIKSIEITNGYSISAQKYGPVQDDGSATKLASINYFVDIETDSTENATSVSKIYQYMSLNLGKNPFFEAVERCQ